MNRRTFLAKMAVVAAALPVVGGLFKKRPSPGFDALQKAYLACESGPKPDTFWLTKSPQSAFEAETLANYARLRVVDTPYDPDDRIYRALTAMHDKFEHDLYATLSDDIVSGSL